MPDINLESPQTEQVPTCDMCGARPQVVPQVRNNRGAALCSRCLNGRHYEDYFNEHVPVYIYDAVHLIDVDAFTSSENADEFARYDEHSGNTYADANNMVRYPMEYCADVLDFCPAAFDSNDLVFGFELEMEFPGRMERGKWLKESTNRCVGKGFIVKEDGSLGTGGAELVSIPLSLIEHRTHGWRNVFKAAAIHGAESASTTTCGIHVHINRSALTSWQIGGLLVFINSETCADLIEHVAQRSPTQYCQRKPKKFGEHNYSKYELVNVKEHTVEIRMFRGNMREDRMLKNLEFCHALVTWLGQSEGSGQPVESPTEFRHWVLDNAKAYPELAKFLNTNEGSN